MKKYGKAFQCLFSAALAVVVVFSCLCCAGAETAKITQADFAAEGYSPRRGIVTILVMGVDDYGKEMVTTGYLNYMQSDFMTLLVMDEAAGKIDILHLNRDTMTEINRIGVFGSEEKTIVAQLALAHAYGSGGSDSNLNAVKAVSNLLGGIRIDHYMTFSMESVPLINDLLGGVTVVVQEDLTNLDPSLKKGNEVTLHGQTALKFVQQRYNVGDSTNVSRMGRQQQYMTGLYQKLMDALAKNEKLASTLAAKLGDNFLTDCSIYQLDELAGSLGKCEMMPFRTIPGTFQAKQFLEYYLKPADLHDVVRDLFYEPSA